MSQLKLSVCLSVSYFFLEQHRPRAMLRGICPMLLMIAMPYVAGALRHQPPPARQNRAAIITMEAQDSKPQQVSPKAKGKSAAHFLLLNFCVHTATCFSHRIFTDPMKSPNISVRLMEENRQRMLLESLEDISQPSGRSRSRRFDPLSSPNVASFFTQQTPQTVAWPLAFIIIVAIQPWDKIFG